MGIVSTWRAASSIILLSRSTGRVLLMKRGDGAAFMPGSYVFPGGVTDKSDEKLGNPIRVSAIRELFEETGILVLKDGLKTSAHESKLQTIQRNTTSDASVLHKIISSDEIGVESLVPWSTWLTPTHHNRRYMTSFFVLPIDDEPEVRICAREMSDYAWADPQCAIDRAYSGEMPLPPPQIYELTRLSQIPISDIARFENKQIICPQWVLDGSGWVHNILPGDHRYIDENSYQQPTRRIDNESVNFSLPTHRLVFRKTPTWGKTKVYQHKLDDEKYQFHRFQTESQIQTQNSKF